MTLLVASYEVSVLSFRSRLSLERNLSARLSWDLAFARDPSTQPALSEAEGVGMTDNRSKLRGMNPKRDSAGHHARAVEIGGGGQQLFVEASGLQLPTSGFRLW